MIYFYQNFEIFVYITKIFNSNFIKIIMKKIYYINFINFLKILEELIINKNMYIKQYRKINLKFRKFLLYF